jgi:hypothetical protein
MPGGSSWLYGSRRGPAHRLVPKRGPGTVPCGTQGGLEGCENLVATGSTDEADQCGDCRRHRRQVERERRRAQLR